MKFTLNWLKEYIDVDLPVEVVADKLTMLGLEVDNVIELYRDLVAGTWHLRRARLGRASRPAGRRVAAAWRRVPA